MYNCKMHEVIITVNQTSRFGQAYDTAHVESIFQTDDPIPDTDVFLVPSDENVPPEILAVMKLEKVSFAPVPQSQLTTNISDIVQEVIQHQKDNALSDAALIMAAMYMKPVTFKSVGNNCYTLSYDYKLYSDPKQDFYIYAKLPFVGFNMPAGGQVRFIVVMPLNAQIDQAVSKGISVNNQVIPGQTTNASGREVISFSYQNDPDFTIKYRY